MKVVIVGGVAGGASCAARLLVANEQYFRSNLAIEERIQGSDRVRRATMQGDGIGAVRKERQAQVGHT